MQSNKAREAVALFDVIEPRYRASATGLMLSCAFIAGALAPVLLGWTKGMFGLSSSISGLAVAYFTSSMVVLAALRTCFAKDCCGERDFLFEERRAQ